MKKLGVLLLVALLTGCQNNHQSVTDYISPTASAIIGGDPVDANDEIAKVTVMITTQFQREDGTPVDVKSCTGVIISKTAILTAAHCFKTDIAHAKHRSLIGYGSDLTSPTRVKKWAKQVILHKEFKDDGSYANDIAIVLLNEPPPYPNGAAKLLRSYSTLYDGRFFTAVGFGQIDEATGEDPNVLQAVLLRVIDIQPATVTVDNSNYAGICLGDSGGPAFKNDGGNQYVWGLNSNVSGRGESSCNGTAEIVRLDHYRSFFAPYLDK